MALHSRPHVRVIRRGSSEYYRKRVERRQLQYSRSSNAYTQGAHSGIYMYVRIDPNHDGGTGTPPSRSLSPSGTLRRQRLSFVTLKLRETPQVIFLLRPYIYFLPSAARPFSSLLQFLSIAFFIHSLFLSSYFSPFNSFLLKIK